MISKEVREELRAVHSELRKPFPVESHSIRELPGTSNLYIYLPWEAIRDRLDEICPDYQFEFTLPEYDHTANLVTCVVTLEILGIKKQALAAVPITQINAKTQKDMSRGNAVDRLHAEAIKNGAEAHCCGRYISNQLFCYKLLLKHKERLDDETRGKLNKMHNQFREAMQSALGYADAPKPQKQSEKNQPSILHAMAGVNHKHKISEGQVRRLWGMGKGELGLSTEAIKLAYKQYGFDKAEDINTDKYDAVIDYMKILSERKAEPHSSKTDNVVPFTSSLYPQHNAFVKRISVITGHNADWIMKQCSHYGGNEPGDLDPSKLRLLIQDIAVDYGFSSCVYADREKAAIAFHGKVAFYEGAGQKWGQGVLDWITETQQAAQQQTVR
ncbi:MAG: hypothetical protein HC862_02805 [Scytonema sp. RU_4_4]|nr:hypothetical protein [Scytonema sp. RU_4_4]